MRDAIVAGVWQTIRQHCMLPRNRSFLVGVSGGVDSVCLLHILLQLASRHGWRIEVAHFNHGLRETAKRDEEFVRNLAQELRVPCHIGGSPEGVKGRNGGLEAAARRVRYEYLQKVRRERALGALAVGHHADDQAETVLMRLLKGAGKRGLAGMPPKRGSIVRPLIYLTRQDLVAYAARHGLRYVEDESNRDLRFFRNRIRWRLLPFLEDYNPNIREILCRIALIQREEEEYLDALAQEEVERLATRDSGSDCSVPLQDLNALPEALLRRVVRLLVKRAIGAEPDYDTTMRLIDLAKSGRVGRQLRFSKGLNVVKGSESLHFVRPGGRQPVTREVELWRKNNPTQQVTLELPSWGLMVKVELVPRCRLHELLSAYLRAKGVEAEDNPLVDLIRQEQRLRAGLVSSGSPSRGYFDPQGIVGRLVLRPRRPGDRIEPLGMAGTRKLKDVLIDAKVSRHLRDHVPIVADDKGPLWVPGLCFSRRVAVAEQTTRILCLTITAK